MNKSRIGIVVLFGIPFTAMFVAMYMYFAGALVPEGRTNEGELLLPPFDLASLELRDANNRIVQFAEQQEYWTLLLVTANCNEACEQHSYAIRQTYKALGKEAGRVRRAIATEQPLTNLDEANYPDLIKYRIAADKINVYLGQKKYLQLYFVDPLGNIMMRYSSDQFGKPMLKDLKKLLKLSNIG